MTASERQFAVDLLISGEARLIGLLDGLSEEQWKFRESPDRWSIAENIEHLILVENFIAAMLTRITREPPTPGATIEKDVLVMELDRSRQDKIEAREVNRPKGRWPEPAELLLEFRKAHAGLLTFAGETQADLRSHFFAHVAFGDIDCYQWLMVMGKHDARHAFQIEEIKAHPAYPRS